MEVIGDQGGWIVQLLTKGAVACDQSPTAGLGGGDYQRVRQVEPSFLPQGRCIDCNISVDVDQMKAV
jgi:hypothetical protein